MLVELIKIADSLDKKAEYDLSNEIQSVINDIIQRARVSPEDLAALANYYDEQGDTKVADKFDALLSKTLNK